jgi:hypothetical protein
MKPAGSPKPECASKLRHTMRPAGLKEVRFRFDLEGTKLVIS